MSDRRVHARLAGTHAEVVRYERAGKWYLEYPGGSRYRLAFSKAVAHGRVAKSGGGQVFLGLPGGSKWDEAVNGE